LRIDVLILKNLYNLALVKFIQRELDLIKEEENMLLIDDFNRIIARVVKNEPVPFIYERIGERYDHFLLDEFQDTSVKQWHNFVPLIDNALANGKQNLVVGDGKQAIYRFRDGEIELFSRLPEIYRADSLVFKRVEANFKREYTSDNLKYNFRSKKEIVLFNNDFYNVLKESLGEFEPVYDECFQIPKRKEGGMVKVEILEKGTDDDEDVYLQKILDSIKEARADEYQCGDIAVLTRKNKELKTIAEFLSNNKIRVESTESLTLKKHEGIQFLIALLRFLVNPDNTETRFWVYRFLVFKFDKKPIKSLEEINKEKIPLEEKLKPFDILPRFEVLRSHSAGELFIELEAIFGLGLQNSDYFKTLLDLASEYQKKQGRQLEGFLEWWDEEDPAISTPDNPNAVKLMTIHKAKGLEFPVVIFPYTDWRKKQTKSFKWVKSPAKIAKELPKSLIRLSGAGLENTPFHDDFKYEKNKSLLDDINIIYVATTRPTERLYFFTTSKPRKDEINFQIIEAFQKMGMEESKSYVFGKRHKKKTENKFDSKSVPRSVFLEDFIRIDPRKALTIACEFKKYRPETVAKALDYGKAVHQLFAGIETEKDINDALFHAQSTGLLSQKETREIEKIILRLFKLELVKKWFGVGGKKYLERELIDENGKILRPDRVVISDDSSVSVIDYKTGNIGPEEIKKYTRQVMNYINAIKNTGYQNVKGFVLSIDAEKVIQINPD